MQTFFFFREIEDDGLVGCMILDKAYKVEWQHVQGLHRIPTGFLTLSGYLPNDTVKKMSNPTTKSSEMLNTCILLTGF